MENQKYLINLILMKVLKELFKKNSKLKNFHNGLNLDRINENFLNNRDLNESQRKYYLM